MTDGAGDQIAPLGTWLADVPRDATLEIVELMNLGIRALEYARDTMLFGRRENDHQPLPGQSRIDATAQTAQRVIETVDDVERVTAAIPPGVSAAKNSVR
jgi:hypothetical protein